MGGQFLNGMVWEYSRPCVQTGWRGKCMSLKELAEGDVLEGELPVKKCILRLPG